MFQKPKFNLISGIFLFLFTSSSAALAQQNSGQLFHCLNDSRTWTLYESSSPNMFQQEIGVMGPGTFTLTMIANGFGFEGFSYSRPSAWDKWQFEQKTNKGKQSWTQSWRVSDNETRLGLLQLIKNNGACPNCTITMRMSTSLCKSNHRVAPTRQPCAVNYCLSRQALYGVAGGKCVSKPGWNGGNC